MKSIVLKYGTISGLLMATLMFASVPLEQKLGFDKMEFVGYAGMIISLIPMYIGIRTFSQTEGNGAITFWKALNVGILIVVISGLFYTVSWLVIYYWITPDFADKYGAFVIEQLKSAGKSQKDIDVAVQQMAQYKEMCKNPFVLGAITFTEPLPSGIILTLICAAILRKKANPDTFQEAVEVKEEKPLL